MTTYPHGATAASEIEPDDATVEQEEAPPGLGCIPVTVEGPVRSVELPAKGNGSRRYPVGTTQPVRILGRDPRRKRATVQVYDATGATRGIFHGATETELTPTDGATAPAFAARLAATGPASAPVASELLVITSLDELWVIADTAACEVSVISEQWAG